MMDEARLQVVKDVDPTILGARSHKEAFAANNAEFESWVTAHGRRPRETSADSFERRLAAWMKRTRGQYVDVGDLAPIRHTKRQRAAWVAKLDEVAQRVHERGMPNPANLEEQRDYEYLRGLRTLARSGRLPDELRALLDQRIPDWAGSDEARVVRAQRSADVGVRQLPPATNARRRAAPSQRAGKPIRRTPEGLRAWHDQLERFTATVQERGGFPLAGSASHAWLGNQRRHEREGRLETELIAKLDAAMPEWRGLHVPRTDRQ